MLLLLRVLLLTAVGLFCTELLSSVHFYYLICIVLLCVKCCVTVCVVLSCEYMLYLPDLPASSRYPEGPAVTGHLDTVFSRFPCV
jgi:hypothetical protein